METIIMENQMEKKMENDMETGIILRGIRLPVEGLFLLTAECLISFYIFLKH